MGKRPHEGGRAGSNSATSQRPPGTTRHWKGPGGSSPGGFVGSVVLLIPRFPNRTLWSQERMDVCCFEPPRLWSFVPVWAESWPTGWSGRSSRSPVQPHGRLGSVSPLGLPSNISALSEPLPNAGLVANPARSYREVSKTHENIFTKAICPVQKSVGPLPPVSWAQGLLLRKQGHPLTKHQLAAAPPGRSPCEGGLARMGVSGLW